VSGCWQNVDAAAASVTDASTATRIKLEIRRLVLCDFRKSSHDLDLWVAAFSRDIRGPEI